MNPLPLEINRAILNQVESKTDLCTVARASRSLQAEAESLIYRHIGDMDTLSSIVCFKQVLASPRLPLYVRSFNFSPHFWGVQRMFWSIFILLSRVLRRTSLLRRLSLDLPVLPLGIDVLTRCDFKLLEFTATFYNTHQFQFLEGQNELRILQIKLTDRATGPSEWKHRADILPNLSVLVAGGMDACYLIPGRPVTRLWVTLSSSERSLNYLALPSIPLKALGTHLSWKDNAEEFLREVSDLVPDLEILCLNLMTNISRSTVGSFRINLLIKAYDFQGLLRDAARLLTRHLPRFRRLQQLDLCVRRGKDETYESLLLQVLGAYPSLRVVRFTGTSEHNTWVWTRGSAGLTASQMRSCFASF
jgi:hypothetical protein